VIEVLSTGGDASLGGDDWDAAIMTWLIEEHLKPARVDFRVGRGRCVCGGGLIGPRDGVRGGGGRHR
jgi:hypothetical protein